MLQKRMANHRSYPLVWCLQYLAYFLGSYFAIGVIFDLFTLGVLGISTFQYSTNSGAFLKAVQEVAGSGRDGRLSVAEKASVAVNTAKVASALNTITKMLKVQSRSALHPLGA